MCACTCACIHTHIQGERIIREIELDVLKGFGLAQLRELAGSVCKAVPADDVRA